LSEPVIDVAVTEGVALARLRRPSKLNAMNHPMMLELHALLDRIATEQIRALVITGDQRAFSAGADLAERLDDVPPHPNWLDTLNRMAAAPVPTIAAIEGHCLGGGLLLAACCDLRVAGETARLGAPEVLRGFFFGTGGTWRLPRIIGPARAKELFFYGDPIDARTAERWGLVNWVVPAGEALAVASERARRLARGPGLALREIKRLVDEGLEVPLEGGLALEEEGGNHLLGSEDVAEGVRAFLEGRPPEFRGR
jgi:enoyl-CoA hydratase/carnithine racemase